MSGLKQTFVTKLTDVNSSAKEPLGSLRIEGNKIYKYMQIQNTTATVAAPIGSQILYHAATGALNNYGVVDADDADATPIAAGINAGTLIGTAGTAEYGWVQIKGPATLGTNVASGAIGDAFIGSTTDLTFTVATSAMLVKSAGISQNATTGVILDCPF